MTVPILQSLLLADHVYRDQTTGKHIICGVFSTIFFTPNLPPEKPQLEPGEKPNMPALPSHGEKGLDAGLPASGGGAIGYQDEGRPRNETTDSSQPRQSQQPIQNLVQAGSPYVYFSVTEVRGRKTFEVRYVDLHENRSLFQAEVPIECDDPLKTIEVALPLPRLPLSAWEERSYALEVVCEGHLLGSHRVLARITPSQPPK